jgi:hypothetical protein
MNKSMLDLLAFKLSENMLYISLANKLDYLDMTPSSYQNGFDLSTITNKKLHIQFKKPQSAFQIHMINFNVQHIHNGLCHLMENI